MIMKSFCRYYLLLSSVSIVLFSCSNESGQLYRKKNFDSLIDVVSRNHTKELDGTEELIADSAFKEIFAHSSAYFHNVMSLLSKNEVDRRQAYFCVFAMQNLKLEDYIRLCNIYLQLYDNGKISEYTLERLVEGGFLKITIIQDNIDNPDVIIFLKKIQDDKKASKEFKKYIEDIAPNLARVPGQRQ